MGLDATADLPIAKLKKQLDVNLVAQVSVTQVIAAEQMSFHCTGYIALRLIMLSLSCACRHSFHCWAQT